MRACVKGRSPGKAANHWKCEQTKLFLRKLFWPWCFITAVVTLTPFPFCHKTED